MSSHFDFRADDATLLLELAKPNPTFRDADRGLAYGLAHAGDRDLWIVRPLDLVEPTVVRAAFLDVLLRAHAVDGSAVVALIEVKLSEPGFGGCSAFDAADDSHLLTCATNGPFGGDPAGCFQPHRPGRPLRRYDEFLSGIPQTSSEIGCPFWYANQPMRIAALASAMVEREDADRAVVGLCAPHGYGAMWRRWREAVAVLDDLESVSLVGLPASSVVRLHADGGKELAARYFSIR